MKKDEFAKIIKKELTILNILFITFYNRKLFVENSSLYIKIAILTYKKILNKKKNKYLINIINIVNIQKRLKFEYINSKYNSIKMIYNKIIYINMIILKNHDKLLKL